jgi:copper chaperone NosL
VWLAALALFLGCAAGPPQPEPLDTRNELCAQCRMAASDARFAAQLVAPREFPKFFDDVGCLAEYLKAQRGGLPAGAVAFVADHRTKEWVRAAAAVYTRVDGLSTPMDYHLVAHADGASREADKDARGGAPQTAGQVFGDAGPPDGR